MSEQNNYDFNISEEGIKFQVFKARIVGILIGFFIGVVVGILI